MKTIIVSILRYDSVSRSRATFRNTARFLSWVTGNRSKERSHHPYGIQNFVSVLISLITYAILRFPALDL